MTSASFVSAEELPDPHELDPRRQILWALSLVKRRGDADLLTGAQVSEMLEEEGIAISRQRVVSILEKERAVGTIKRTRRAGIACFRIMRLGEDEILQATTQSIFIEPAKALSSIRAVEEVLRSLRGNIRICDTYVDSRTLDYLAEIKMAQAIQLLTENIQDSSRLRRDLVAFGNEHHKALEVRVAPAGQLHDRYMIHSDGMLWVGASLKDLGKKQSMVIALPKTFAAEIEAAFGRRWSVATKFS